MCRHSSWPVLASFRFGQSIQSGNRILKGLNRDGLGINQEDSCDDMGTADPFFGDFCCDEVIRAGGEKIGMNSDHIKNYWSFFAI